MRLPDSYLYKSKVLGSIFVCTSSACNGFSPGICRAYPLMWSAGSIQTNLRSWSVGHGGRMGFAFMTRGQRIWFLPTDLLQEQV